MACSFAIGGAAALSSPLGNSDKLSAGQKYEAQKLYSQAVTCYQQAVDERPDSGEAHFFLGRAFSRAGNQDSSLLELFEALKFGYSPIMARSEIAAILMKRASWDEAGGQLKQVLDLQPQDNAVRGNYAICLEQLGFLDQAIEQFRIINKSEPRNVECLYNLALALQLRGLHEEAAVNFRKVISLAPRNSLAYTGLGKCLNARKEYQAAIAVEKQAIQLFPTNHWAYLAMAEAYDSLGNKADALDSYRKAIQLNPKDPACRAALAHLLNQKVAGSARNPLTVR